MSYALDGRMKKMPYIEKTLRFDVDMGKALTAGELNYKITKLIVAYLEDRGTSYQSINDVVGALEGAKAEFQRRVVAPYEDAKIRENGDVYHD